MTSLKFGKSDLLVHSIIPIVSIESTAMRDHTDYQTRVQREIIKFYKKKQKNLDSKVPVFLTTGSRACSLRQSLMYVYDDQGRNTGMAASDCDLMIIEPDTIVGVSGNYNAGLDLVTACHPIGFGEVLVTNAHIEPQLLEDKKGKCYLSAEKFKDDILINVGLNTGINKGKLNIL